MTYSPTDQLHRHFRFLRVPQYSLFVVSDSIGTPVMFTGSVDKATTETAGSPVYSLWLGFSELFLAYNLQQAKYQDFNQYLRCESQNSSRRQVGGLMSGRELKQHQSIQLLD
jgi:hypothetical protein